MRKLLFVLLLLLPAAAQAAGHDVDYSEGAIQFKGYFVSGGKGAKGSVLIIPEWWGLNEYSKSRADQLAALGYNAFAVDMYGSGQVTTDPSKAKEWSGPFYADPTLMTKRVQRGLDALVAQSGVDKNKIAVIGYCFGGSSALQFALSGGDVRGAAAFHGGLKLPAPTDPAAVKAKFVIFEGEDDPFVPAEERAAFRKLLKDAELDFTWIDYSGAIHAFTNPKATSFNIPGIAYNESADRQSWGHLQQFLHDLFSQLDTGKVAAAGKN